MPMNTNLHTMKKTALFIFCFLGIISLQAQLSSLRMVTDSFKVTNLQSGLFSSDTLFTSFGDSIEIEALVVYTGNTITDVIRFGIANDSIMGPNSDTLFIPGGIPDTLNTGDTIKVIVKDQIDSTLGRYSGGTGGGAISVVIWPALRLNPSTIENGAQIIFNFADRTAIDDNEFENANPIICYPNPSNGHLYFSTSINSLNFEYVRIRDLHGRQIFISKGLPEWIDMSAWPSAFYLVEFEFKDGHRLFSKIEKR